MNVIRPSIVLMALLCSCSQNIVNIRGARDRSLDMSLKMTQGDYGSHLETEVHFGPGPGEEIKFGPSPGDG